MGLASLQCLPDPYKCLKICFEGSIGSAGAAIFVCGCPAWQRLVLHKRAEFKRQITWSAKTGEKADQKQAFGYADFSGYTTLVYLPTLKDLWQGAFGRRHFRPFAGTR